MQGQRLDKRTITGGAARPSHTPCDMIAAARLTLAPLGVRVIAHG